MKLGYSILLGELIGSDLIGYEDCRGLQIVCPSCKEPVFKVERKEVETIHYLSHYEKGKGYVEECELRVRSMPNELIESTNAEARGQKLALFLRVFQDAILEVHCSGDPSARGKVMSVCRSRGMQLFRGSLLQRMTEATGAELASMVDGYINDLVEVGALASDDETIDGIPSTPLALSMQKRIVGDMWDLLRSSKGEESLRFLFSFSIIFLASRLQITIESGAADGWGVKIGAAIARLMNSTENQAREILSEMAATPVPETYSVGGNLLAKMCGEVGHEMIGVLARLPYLSILKAHQIATHCASVSSDEKN